MPSAWTYFCSLINPIARELGYYTSYRLHASEYIGTLYDYTVEDARVFLRDNNYTPQYLSAAKKHPESGLLHDLSYRKIPKHHPLGAEGTPLESYDPESCQLHVHCFWHTGGIDVFSHYETRPLAHPLEHYRPTHGDSYLRGVTDLHL